jgi:adenylate cyclase
MRIVYSYQGLQKVWEKPGTDLVIGRADDGSGAILDLSPDQKVSRLHARIWREDGFYWIDDLDSTRGTKLNDVEIKRKGKQQLQPGDVLTVGDTTLRLEVLDDLADVNRTNYLEMGRNVPPETSHGASGIDIAQDVDATVFAAPRVEGSGGESARRLRMVYDLPLQFAAKAKLETLLPAILDQLDDLIPSGDIWALVLLEPGTDALLLKAYRCDQQPYLSETLMRRAIDDRKAFIWRRNMERDASISGSIFLNAMESGIYAPLVWQDEAAGVICASSRKADAAFTEEDLRLMTVVAQYAAMAVASHRLQEQLRRESVAKANLLRQFSPKVADQLLAARGRVRLGGQRSEVTILNSDIRGFTQLAREMDPDDVVEMLNDYFGVLVPVIFKYGGTIDKFMGDAILAVFGSPEPDPKQHQNAVLAALDMQAAVTRLNEARQSRGAEVREFGIGIHSGEVVHGFVGTANRMEFTVIGDAVNRTARYCAGAVAGEIVISPEVHERVWKIVDTERKTIATKHEGDFVAYRVNCSKHARAGTGESASSKL